MEDSAREGDAVDPTGSALDEQVVVECLRSVLGSEALRRAPRAKDLLSYVVTETIAGRGHLLNERVVSRVALGRPPDVDTRQDASARVQARRTRDLLARYYEGEGRDDPVRIGIPTGQYAATFVANVGLDEPHSEQPLRPTSRGPIVAVAELRHRSAGIDRRVAAGLSESFVRAFSRFPGLEVVGPISGRTESAAPVDVLAIADRTRADFVLHGGVTAGWETVRVTVYLTVGATGEVRWSESFEQELERFRGFEAEDEILARVAAAVGDFGGVVFREPVLVRQEQDPVVAEALRQYYSFMDELTPATAPAVVAGLEAALEVEPDSAHVLASLAFAHAVDVLMRGAAASASAAEAERLARQALRVEPTNAVANNVLAIVELAAGRHSRARKHAELALELAPYHPGSAYLSGMVIGASGDWPRGIDIIRRVVSVNPYGPNHRRTLLAVAALMDGDAAAALAEASLLHFPGYVYGPLVTAVCLGEMGLLDEASGELDAVCALVPDFLDRPDEVLGAAPTIPDEAVAHLVDRVEVLAARLGR